MRLSPNLSSATSSNKGRNCTGDVPIELVASWGEWGSDDSVQRQRLWRALAQIDAYVLKMIETNNAFYLITDAAQTEIILDKENKETL